MRRLGCRRCGARAKGPPPRGRTGERYRFLGCASRGPVTKRETPRRRAAGASRGAAGSLLLAPGQRHEGAGRLGDVLLNRVVAVQDGRVAVGLDLGLAVDDDATEDPGVAVVFEVPLDVDHAPISECAVQVEIAVDVEEPGAGAALDGEVAAHVLRRSIVVEIVDPVEVGRNGALAGPHPREELGLRHPERLPGAGVEAALVRHLVVRAAERLGAAAVADGAGGPDAVLVL